MRPLETNLATRPSHNNLLFYLGIAAGVAFLLAFTTYNVYTFTQHSRILADLDAQLADKRAQLKEQQKEADRLVQSISKRDLKDLALKIEAANSILVEREFSWTKLLNALEEAQPYKVRLLDLRPVVSQQGILIDARGIARDLDNFLQLQEKLQEHPKFVRVYPKNYSKSPAGGEILFDVSFNYFPKPEEAPAPGEEAAVNPRTAAEITSRKGLDETGTEEPAAARETPGQPQTPEEHAAPEEGEEQGTRGPGEGAR